MSLSANRNRVKQLLLQRICMRDTHTRTPTHTTTHTHYAYTHTCAQTYIYTRRGLLPFSTRLIINCKTIRIYYEYILLRHTVENRNVYQRI